MRFTMSRKRLAQALKVVVPAAGLRSTLPVLTGVLIEAAKKKITLEATDLESSAWNIVNNGVTVERVGRALVQAKSLAKTIASIDADEITLESIDTDGRAGVALQAGTRTVTLEAYPVEDFPVLSREPALDPLGSVEARVLADAFSRVVLCASRDEARPVLTSVALVLTEGSPTLEVVATDSYRMGVIRVETAEPTKKTHTLLVPARVIKELAKQMRKLRDAVTIGLVDRGDAKPPAAAFSFGHTVWVTRLIEGEFPNWQQIVPEETGAAIEFEVDEMTSALKSVEAIGSGGGTPVRLNLGDPTTVSLVEGQTTRISETLATATFSPDGVGQIAVAFNPQYFADGLQFIGTERAHMWVRDGLKPALIGPADRRYVLMPVRIS